VRNINLFWCFAGAEIRLGQAISRFGRKLQVFSLPEPSPHGCRFAPARVVEEDHLPPGQDSFAVFTEMNRGLRKAIRLAAGVQPYMSASIH